ncbi:unnamed protein product [Ectocarpus sp. 4 AP-2014]
MVKFLQDYFRDRDITVTATLCTWKHWFQDRIYQDIHDGKRSCREAQQCPACKDINHTLVLAMWRNPYDWISGMHKIPWHAQAHANIPDMSKFMTMPWIMGAEQEKQARKEALIRAKDELPCIDNFLPWEVLPCRPGDESAIYELDPGGEAYGNIYELRKVDNFRFAAVTGANLACVWSSPIPSSGRIDKRFRESGCVLLLPCMISPSQNEIPRGCSSVCLIPIFFRCDAVSLSRSLSCVYQ